ncbi:biotin/lipoyl-binding protein, partial [bacterium LRH843]|nr:biotin/lipoyl-binding protein [bacterium LRH843]
FWMATGSVKEARIDAPEPGTSDTRELTSVQVQTVSSQAHEPGLLLQGQLDPWHSVSVSARVPGTVQSISADLGQQVQTGEVLLTISDDGRRAV